MSDGAIALIYIGIAAGGYLAYNGTFYVTGKQWYEACYELKVEQEKAGWSEPKASCCNRIEVSRGAAK